MKVSHILGTFLSISILSTQAWSGGDHSGGGTAVVCRNADHKIQSAQLVDTYEPLEAYGLGYWEFKQPGAGMPLVEKTGDAVKDEELLTEEYNRLLDQKFLSLPNNTSLKLLLTQNMKFVRKEINKSYKVAKEKFPGTYIVAPVDLGGGRAVHVPYGCQPEFAVFYKGAGDGYSDSLEVNPDIWDALSITDRVALIVHESIYEIRRLFYNDHSSELTRDLTARLVVLAHDTSKAYSYWGLMVDLGDYRKLVPSRVINLRDTSVKLTLLDPGSATVRIVMYDQNGNKTGGKTISVSSSKPSPSVQIVCDREWVKMKVTVLGARSQSKGKDSPDIQFEAFSQEGELQTRGSLTGKRNFSTILQAANISFDYPVTKPFTAAHF